MTGRKDYVMGYYDYVELREKALNGTQKDVNLLGEWFEMHGSHYWNGEYFDADNGYRLYRNCDEKIDEDGELMSADIIGYEFR